jgi:predicted RNase H-like HicB family nuclease
VKRYRVVYERDESGMWIAYVTRIPGCHTHGRTIEQARRHIGEALSLWMEDAHEVELVDEIRLPRRAEAIIRRTHAAREQLRAAHEEARAATAAAARMLVEDLDLSLRDAAELLGLTRQRVQQVVAASRAD